MTYEQKRERAARSFARRMGKAYRIPYADLDDLEQAARIGAWVADTKWDESKGASRGTWWKYHMRSYVQAELGHYLSGGLQGAYALMRPGNDRSLRIKKHWDETHDVALTAERAGVSESVVLGLLSIGLRFELECTDRTKHDGFQRPVQVAAADSDARKREVNRAARALPDRLRTVLRRRVEGWSFEDIAAELGVSSTRVGQLETMAIKALQKEMSL